MVMIMNRIDYFFTHIDKLKEKYEKLFILLEHLLQLLFDVSIVMIIFIGHTNFQINKYYRISMALLLLTGLSLIFLRRLKGKALVLDYFLQLLNPLIISILIVVFFDGDVNEISNITLEVLYAFTPLVLYFFLWLSDLKYGGERAWFPVFFCLTILMGMIYLNWHWMFMVLLLMVYILMQFRVYLINRAKTKQLG